MPWIDINSFHMYWETCGNEEEEETISYILWIYEMWERKSQWLNFSTIETTETKENNNFNTLGDCNIKRGVAIKYERRKMTEKVTINHHNNFKQHVNG